jgi:hypothetical protein
MLLKKGQVFVWTLDHEQAFHMLKNALMITHVLALPDFTKTFEIKIDASDKRIGVVLHQAGHPLAFIRKALGPRHQGLSTYEKESLAILMAICGGTSQVIRPTYSCPCPADLGQPCRCT